MAIPSPTAPCWRTILSTNNVPPFSSLATRMIVTRLRQEAKRGGGSMDASVRELHSFFSNNTFALRDLSLVKG